MFLINLCLFAAVFFIFYAKNKRREPHGMRNPNTGAAETAGDILHLICLYALAYPAYSACVVRLTEIIMKGIFAAQYSPLILTVRVLVTESLLAVYPVWCAFKKETYDRCQELLYAEAYYHDKNLFSDKSDFPVSFSHNGYAYPLILGLLFLMALYGWQESRLVYAFILEILALSCLIMTEAFELFSTQKMWQERKNEEAARQKEKSDDYINNVDLQYQRTRELWHDLKNHIGVMQILLQEKNYEKLNEYLTEFQTDVEGRMIPVRSGNSAVDALLSDKLYRAKKSGIAVSIRLCPLKECRIRTSDLCAILGNLIDNAIEGCLNYEKSRRLCHPLSIDLSIKKSKEFYYMVISNNALEPVKEGGAFLSGKTDMDNGVGHGLGLRSVERIVHQYGGSLAADYADERFTVVVRMQL